MVWRFLKQFFLLSIFYSFVKCQSELSTENIFAIANHLKMSFLTILTPNNLERVNIAKTFSNHGYKTSFKFKDKDSFQSVLEFVDKPNKAIANPKSDIIYLVVTRIDTINDLDDVDLAINQEVYFLDKISMNIYECYTINGHKIKRHLGKYKADKNSNAVDFHASNEYSSRVSCK